MAATHQCDLLRPRRRQTAAPPPMQARVSRVSNPSASPSRAHEMARCSTRSLPAQPSAPTSLERTIDNMSSSTSSPSNPSIVATRTSAMAAAPPSLNERISRQMSSC
eukprot:scaffold240947_cov27-Tisochrysis_lutea.AAC.2